MKSNSKMSTRVPDDGKARFVTRGTHDSSARGSRRGASTDSQHKPSKPRKAKKRAQRLSSSSVHSFIRLHHKNVFEHERKVAPKHSGSLMTLDRRSYEPLTEDTLSISQSLVDPLSVYRFRLGGYTTAGRTSGVTNTFIAADPSASGWNSPEWATLSALFSEFRLVELGVRICRNYLASVTTGVATLAICSNLGSAANPGSYAAVADNADAVLYSYLDTSRFTDGRSGVVHRMHATDLNWSQVATPTVEPYAGAPGSIQLYADNALASGTDSILYQILIWGIYEFRIRS